LVSEVPHPFPGQPVELAAPPKRLAPVPDDPFAEGGERLDVVGHRVIAVVPGQDAGEPATLFWDGQMHPLRHLVFDREQFATHPL